VALQLDLNLVNQALKTSLSNNAQRSTTELLALAELFHNKKASLEALTLIELARARSPFDLDTNLSAAQVYFQRGDLRSTANAFARASIRDRSFAYHATEMHRQLRNFQTATYHAQFIPHAKERLKARMAMYVDGGKFPLIASLDSLISRSELKNDDEMRYALSYSLLRQGNFNRPLIHLNRIRGPEFLQKAALLKKAALDCRTGKCQL
jgi:hypothetical protein